MKSGTQSKLTLVDRNGIEIAFQAEGAEMAVEYYSRPHEEEQVPMQRAAARSRQNQLLVFAAVSTGCAAAAIATGSYALWLSRRKMADDALISVHDILKTCQERVTQIEADLTHLPIRQSASPSGTS